MPLYSREEPNEERDALRIYSDEDMQDLLFGLGMSASGGGGGYHIGQALVDAIIAEVHPSQRVLYPVSQAKDDEFAAMAGGIGAPSAITPGNITKFAEYCIVAINKYNVDNENQINALVPVEAGPVNALLAMYVGWTHGIKVFDCDGAGRAVPSLTNLAYDYNDYPIAPLYLAGVKPGELHPTAAEVLPPPKNGADAEAKIRDNLPVYGNAAGLLCWGQTGTQLRNSEFLVDGQMDAMRQFGSELRKVRGSSIELLAYLQSRPDLVAQVFATKLKSIETDPRPGYDDGTLIFESIDPPNIELRIKYENENMIMTAPELPAITAPNGLAMLFPYGPDGLTPLNNGDDLPNAGVIGGPAVVVVLKERCVLYNRPLSTSFSNVLRNEPFNYDGPLQPTDCVA
ncbi:hypothetical protein GCM10009096_07180 [Parasphingorhabdus litoris]|uniref:DUF917 domain-containing protein n=1 Tax=Parasphingorhabdus litoris TaxID=394733 RepID=A0ABN1A6M0_9SPHN|nr:DUF917 family protein [Parasphingorhabdus litoris]